MAMPELDEALSVWLGTAVRLVEPRADRAVHYRMTFDPPDDDAELFDIPTPDGTFLDLAPVHLLTTATLDGVRAARPDLDWDVRRFRPNLVLDVAGAPFVENDWSGRRLALGDGCGAPGRSTDGAVCDAVAGSAGTGA